MPQKLRERRIKWEMVVNSYFFSEMQWYFISASYVLFMNPNLLKLVNSAIIYDFSLSRRYSKYFIDII